MIAKWSACLVLALWFTQAAAQPRAGEYVSAGGWDTLFLQAPASGEQAFSIKSFGANGHMCELAGRLHGRRASADGWNGAACAIDIVRQGKGLQVTPEATEACRSFCGARAGFAALYIRVPAGCTKPEVRRTRDAFLQLYQRKQYAQARAVLVPVMEKCEPQLFYTDAADIRNDMAVTLYHLGEKDACLLVLQPLQELAQTSDEELREGYPPIDSGNYLDIAGKTRTNLKLCNGLH